MFARAAALGRLGEALPGARLSDGPTDEAELGFTYEMRYGVLSGEEVTPSVGRRISHLAMRFAHKRRPPPKYDPVDGSGV